MQVIYEPEHSASGLTSFLTWDHPDFHRALNQAFAVQKDERIVRVEVTKQGIKAILEIVRKKGTDHA
jgi:hypothetical protein